MSDSVLVWFESLIKGPTMSFTVTGANGKIDVSVRTTSPIDVELPDYGIYKPHVEWTGHGETLGYAMAACRRNYNAWAGRQKTEIEQGDNKS